MRSSTRSGKNSVAEATLVKMKKWMPAAAGAAIVASALLLAPIPAFADTPSPTPAPGTVVDPRPAPLAQGTKSLTEAGPLGAHLPRLAPGTLAGSAAHAAPASTAKVMPVMLHQPKIGL
ncbi:hypothetical protein BH11ACT3_BH11ACT3_04400 [soil metagenome]